MTPKELMHPMPRRRNGPMRRVEAMAMATLRHKTRHLFRPTWWQGNCRTGDRPALPPFEKLRFPAGGKIGRLTTDRPTPQQLWAHLVPTSLLLCSPARQKAAALRKAKTVHPHVSGTGLEEFPPGRAVADPEGRGTGQPSDYEGGPRKPSGNSGKGVSGTQTRPPASTKPSGTSTARCVQLSEWRSVAPRGGRKRKQRVRDSRSLVVWGLPHSAAPSTFAQRLAQEGVAGMAALPGLRGKVGRVTSRSSWLRRCNEMQCYPRLMRYVEPWGQTSGPSSPGPTTPGRRTGAGRREARPEGCSPLRGPTPTPTLGYRYLKLPSRYFKQPCLRLVHGHRVAGETCRV